MPPSSPPVAEEGDSTKPGRHMATRAATVGQLEHIGAMAAAMIQPGQIVGLGSGRAAHAFVRMLGRRRAETKMSLTAVATSQAEGRLTSALTAAAPAISMTATMSEESETRRQYLQIDAVDPDDGKPTKVQISYDRLHALAARGTVHIHEAAHVVPYVLQRPTAIFEGLRQDVDEDQRGVGGRCYCAIPEHSYRPDGTAVPPYPGQVYLVFVNQDGVAYNWRWEQSDPAAPALPMNHTTRFKERRL